MPREPVCAAGNRTRRRCAPRRRSAGSGVAMGPALVRLSRARSPHYASGAIGRAWTAWYDPAPSRGGGRAGRRRCMRPAMQPWQPRRRPHPLAYRGPTGPGCPGTPCRGHPRSGGATPPGTGTGAGSAACDQGRGPDPQARPPPGRLPADRAGGQAGRLALPAWWRGPLAPTALGHGTARAGARRRGAPACRWCAGDSGMRYGAAGAWPAKPLIRDWYHLHQQGPAACRRIGRGKEAKRHRRLRRDRRLWRGAVPAAIAVLEAHRAQARKTAARERLIT